MIVLFNKLLDWFKVLFWKEEMEFMLVGLQYLGKIIFVNVIVVSVFGFFVWGLWFVSLVQCWFEGLGWGFFWCDGVNEGVGGFVYVMFVIFLKVRIWSFLWFDG